MSTKPDLALAECRRVTAGQSNNPRAWKITGQVFLLKQDDLAAATALNRSWTLDPQVDTDLLLITSDLGERQPEQASEIARQIVHRAGESSRLYLTIANVYRSADNLVGTIAHLTHATALDPNFAPGILPSVMRTGR